MEHGSTSTTMVNSQEEWRSILGHEGRYEVSSLGRVRSLLPHQGQAGPRILKQNINPVTGYAFVRLFTGGRPRHQTVYIHREILRAFVGPRAPEMEACHNDGDRTNNLLSNLRYDTRSANAQDRARHGRFNHFKAVSA